MDIQDLDLPGVKLIKLEAFIDNRGFFEETFHEPRYRKLGIPENFVQDNHSFSKKGVIRGMHFQSTPGQAKLVSVSVGRIYDVFVDIRPHSPTFGKWSSYILKAENHEQLLVPVGFAHGFAVLSDEAHVQYKVSSVFDPETEKGFCYDDPDVGIAWPEFEPILSEKDRNAQPFKEVVYEGMDLRSRGASWQSAH